MVRIEGDPPPGFRLKEALRSTLSKSGARSISKVALKSRTVLSRSGEENRKGYATRLGAKNLGASTYLFTRRYCLKYTAARATRTQPAVQSIKDDFSRRPWRSSYCNTHFPNGRTCAPNSPTHRTNTAELTNWQALL